MTEAGRGGLFFNRELSWLAFNQRVLEEAADTSVPLLERIRFAAIAASNLDEFFMVRVAGLKQAVAEGDTSPDLSGLTPERQLTAIAERAHDFVAELYRLTLHDLCPALAVRDIRLLAYADVSESQRASLSAHFEDAVLPVLTPLAIDTERPFPLLGSLSLNVAVLLDAAPEDEGHRLAIVQVPPGLNRLVRIAAASGVTFVLLEDIVRGHLLRLFPGQPIFEAAVIRIARDAELEMDDEGGRTHLELVEREVRRRRRGDAVRLEIDEGASDAMVSSFQRRLNLTDADVYLVPGPLDLRVLMSVAELPGFEELRDPPVQPVDALSGEQRDLFSVL